MRGGGVPLFDACSRRLRRAAIALSAGSALAPEPCCKLTSTLDAQRADLLSAANNAPLYTELTLQHKSDCGGWPALWASVP